MTIRRFSLAVLLAIVLVPGLATAATDPLSYDDPGMHFRPPDGWTRVPADQLQGGSPGGGPSPAVAYFLRKGSNDIRTILITIDGSFNGNVDELDRAHEGELRKTNEGTFIDKHEKTTLTNGMPAFWLRASEGTQVGAFTRRYEWLVADGTRSIIVSYTGKQGAFDEKEAREALASLYVVAYPRGRRTPN
jgi:hypothetical protein